MTFTQLIPIFVVSGEAGATTKALCKDLGASAYFEKPIDFDGLRSSLVKVLGAKREERRGEVRVGLHVPIKLRSDANGKLFEEETVTENVALSSFLCGCTAVLAENSSVWVSLRRGGEQLVGKARVVRCQDSEASYPRYAFRFVEKTGAWVLQ